MTLFKQLANVVYLFILHLFKLIFWLYVEPMVSLPPPLGFCFTAAAIGMVSVSVTLSTVPCSTSLFCVFFCSSGSDASVRAN